MTTPPTPPEAIVFDCDGLLLETEDCWTLAESELFARYGRTFGDEEKRTLIGTSLLDGSLILERLLDQPGRAEPLGWSCSNSSNGGSSRRRSRSRAPRSSCST